LNEGAAGGREIVIGPTSLGLLLDAVGVSLLSYAFFSTTLKLRRAVEQSIVEAESALLAGGARRAGPSSDWAKLPAPDLEKSLLTMRRDRSHVQWHLWLIICGATCLICGLTSQLWGSWPN
jgi:hypothetical protein